MSRRGEKIEGCIHSRTKKGDKNIRQKVPCSAVKIFPPEFYDIIIALDFFPRAQT